MREREDESRGSMGLYPYIFFSVLPMVCNRVLDYFPCAGSVDSFRVVSGSMTKRFVEDEVGRTNRRSCIGTNEVMTTEDLSAIDQPNLTRKGRILSSTTKPSVEKMAKSDQIPDPVLEEGNSITREPLIDRSSQEKIPETRTPPYRSEHVGEMSRPLTKLR